MGGSKRGLGSVIVCLLVLGLVLKQVQHVEGVDCGGSIFKVACYHSCLLGPSTVFQCADFCGCHLPADLAFVRSSDELNTIEYCSLECRSSMCDNMVMVNIAINSEEMKLYVKLCGDACDSLCKGNALLASLDLDD
ncbi:type-5 thionin-like [Triticum dicoccoides]|uniref:type-5 thionin-like n=1 Tax=Triticum dicoccoides TaxID=85692 RepID=UPI000E7C8652|nr:type-5 thionin-like [Triticum dicoccoides]